MPITVGFRFDADSPAAAQAVIKLIELAGPAVGLTIMASPHHRPKRPGGQGVFWDGYLSIPDGGAEPEAPVQATATRIRPGQHELPPGRTRRGLGEGGKRR